MRLKRYTGVILAQWGDSKGHWVGARYIVPIQIPGIGLLYIFVLLAAIMFVSVSGTHPAAAQGANKLGVHLLLDDGRNQWPVEVWREHLGYARYAVGDWGYVTELIRGDDLDTARWQIF